MGAISAGSIQASRLMAPTEEHIFVAAANHLYFINLSYPLAPVFKSGRQGPRISSPVAITDYTVTSLPLNIRAELQSVDILAQSDGGYRSAVSDAVGRTTISTIGVGSSSHVTGKRRRVDTDSKRISDDADAYVLNSYQVGPHLAQETGWTGAALNPMKTSEVATVGYFSRRLDIWNDEKCARTIHTPLNPTQIRYTSVPASGVPLLAITEQNIVSIWDDRTSENNGCIQRLARSQAPLYTLCSHPSGLIATGGEEKTIFVYDVRSWKLVGSWPKVMKYEIVATSFALKDPSYCYVTGLDHEVFCGKWESALGGTGNDADRKFHSTLKRHGFRGDSRWIGIDRVTGSETLVGVTESANLYVLREPHRMLSAMERAASSSAVAAAAAAAAASPTASSSISSLSSLRGGSDAEKKAKADMHRASAAERKAALQSVIASTTAAAASSGAAVPSRKQAKKLAKAELKATKKAEHGAKRKAANTTTSTDDTPTVPHHADGNYRHSNANDRAARAAAAASTTSSAPPS